MLLFFAQIFSRGIRNVFLYTPGQYISNVDMRDNIIQILVFIKDLTIYIILTAGIAYLLTNCK
jgi:hypothetical protein